MSIIQGLAKNTLAVFIGLAVNMAAGFFFVMYVARYLGAEGFGTISFALAFTGILGVLTDLGLSRLLIREVARDREIAGRYLGNTILLKLLLVAVNFGVVSVVINGLGYPRETVNIVYIIAISVIFNSFSTLFYSVFQAHERMEYFTIGQLVLSLLQFSGAVIAVAGGMSIIAFGCIYLLSSFAVLVYSSTLSCIRFARPQFGIDLNFWGGLLRQSWPFGLLAAFSMITYWVDSVMLSFYKGEEVVGWYNAAYRLIMVILFIPGAYYEAVFPVMSRLYATSRSSLKVVFEKSLRYMIILAFPVGIGTTILAERFIHLIFGLDYTNSALALQILVWSTVSIFMSALIAQLFNSLNRQRVVATVTGLSALVNVILNAILIPRYSYVGAAATTVTTEFFTLVVLYIMSTRTEYRMKTGIIGKVLLKVIVSSGVTGLGIFYLQDLSLWVLIPAAALVYCTVLYLCRGVDREDLELVRHLIADRRTGKIVES